MRGGWLLAAVLVGSSAGAPPVLDAGAPADPLAEPRALWAQRADPVLLSRLLAALPNAPGPEARVLAAQAHLFQARTLASHRGARAQAGEALQAARTDALAALPPQHPVDGASPADAPALTVLAAASLELAGHRGALEAAALLHEALAASAKAVAIAPDAADSRAVHASALVALPARAGGDLLAARFEFERAIAAEPLLLSHRVEMAARYAVKAQDRRLFHALLRSALALDVAALPSRTPEQRLARARAIGLLHRERSLFRG